MERIVTDNGACYRADAFTRAPLGAKQKRTKPYTPKHNGKVERYNRILAEEFLYSRTWTSEAQRSAAVAVWNVHYKYWPHSTAGGQSARFSCANPRHERHGLIQVQRAKALLLVADGVANTRISAEVGATPVTVRRWRKRFEQDGLAKLGQVREGRGRKARISREQVRAIVHDTLHTTQDGQTHWSCRTMAKHAGVSAARVQRIWHNLGIKPHRVDQFKVSNDPQLEEKLTDVVGLYLDPHAK